MATKALVRVEGWKHMERSLKKALKSIKDLYEETSSLNDEVVATSNQYFEKAMEYVAFFYLNIDFS